jgi:hypothetical protein
MGKDDETIQFLGNYVIPKQTDVLGVSIQPTGTL